MSNMTKYTLRLKKKIQNPLHLDRISPDEFLDKKISAINDIEAWEGNNKVKLKSIFNIKKDLRDKIEKLWRDPQLRLEMGNNARTKVKNDHDIKVFYSALFENIFCKLM